MKNKIALITAVAGLVAATILPAQAPEEYVAGPFSSSRMALGEFLDDIRLQQWRDTLIAGYDLSGYPWRGFVRMGVDQAYGLGNTTFVSMNKLEQATKITWTSGIVWKQTTGGTYDASGGVDFDVYFIPDLTVPEGATPDFSFFEFDKFPGAVKVGEIPKDYPFTNPEENWGNQTLAREHFNIEVDITDAVKSALDAGLITSGNSFAIGLIPSEYANLDPAVIPTGFQDFGRMSIIAAEDSVFTLSFDDVGPDMGPGVFSDYELIDGYVNTGDWMGWVYVGDYPWSLVVNLNKYVYSGGSGWFYIGK